MKIRLIVCGLATAAVLCALPGTARAQILVVNSGNGAPGAGSIGEYTTSGALLNPALISGLTCPAGIAISGDKLFVVNFLAGTISEYTTSGALVNPSLISGLNFPGAIAVSGGFLYVSTSAVNVEADMIGKYTTSGATVNATLIPGLGPVGDIKVSGNNLFYSDGIDNLVAKYTTSGALLNPNLVPNFVEGVNFARGIAVSGDKLFVVDEGTFPGTGTIGEYTTSGATVNPNLITGLIFPGTVALLGEDLFVTSGVNLASENTMIGEYTTSGATVNAALISGLNNLGDFAVLPESVPDASSTWTLLLLALTATFGLKLMLRQPT